MRSGKRTKRPRSVRRVRLAVGLFLLAPFVGEYVLGNQPLTALPQILLLAPMYGGGAVIIREVGRRTQSAWPVIAVLAVAYALVEEGLIDQMIFNPGYLGLPSFAGLAPIPGLRISATLALDSVALHAIGSTSVPIAIMEAFDPAPARPWLGPRGLGVVVAIFVLGSCGLAVLQAKHLRFVGTGVQFAVTTALVVGLIALARLLVTTHSGWSSLPKVTAAARAPHTVGLAAFAVTSMFWLTDLLLRPATDDWLCLLIGASVLAAGAVLLVRESHRPGWGPHHRLAAAAGALATYGWLAFINTAQLGIPLVLGIVGNLIFGTSAAVLLLLAHRANTLASTEVEPPSARPARSRDVW